VTAEALLTALRARGVELRVEGDALRFRRTADPVAADDIEAMRANKLALVALLRAAHARPDAAMAAHILATLERRGETSSATLARELGTHYDPRHPERYVSVETVASALVHGGRLLGRMSNGAWLLRLPGGGT
jgi:hypothetical protein